MFPLGLLSREKKIVSGAAGAVCPSGRSHLSYRVDVFPCSRGRGFPLPPVAYSLVGAPEGGDPLPKTQNGLFPNIEHPSQVVLAFL